jgi:hypothetical protein
MRVILLFFITFFSCKTNDKVPKNDLEYGITISNGYGDYHFIVWSYSDSMFYYIVSNKLKSTKTIMANPIDKRSFIKIVEENLVLKKFNDNKDKVSGMHNVIFYTKNRNSKFQIEYNNITYFNEISDSFNGLVKRLMKLPTSQGVAP